MQLVFCYGKDRMRGSRENVADIHIPFALAYDLRTVSLTLSIQRDSTPSKPPSPSINSSLLISTGPSLSRNTMPLRLRINMTHTRKNKSMKRNVDRTMSNGNSMSRASCGGWLPRPSGISTWSGTSTDSFWTLVRISRRVLAAEGDNKYGPSVRESCNVDWMPLRAMFNEEDLLGQYNKESEVRKWSVAVSLDGLWGPELTVSIFPYSAPSRSIINMQIFSFLPPSLRYEFNPVPHSFADSQTETF
jgi:hypothetical protein